VAASHARANFLILICVGPLVIIHAIRKDDARIVKLLF